MEKMFVIFLSLFFIGGLGHRFPVPAQYVLPFAVSPSKLFAEERQPAEQPKDWESLPPEMKKFFLELGNEQQKPQNQISKEEEKRAVGVSSRWLRLVDEGKYKDACEKVGDYMLAAAVGQHHEIDKCVDRLKRTRNNLGPIITRKHLSAKFISDESLVEITFSTASEKKTVREIIIISMTVVGMTVEEYYVQEDRGEPRLVIPYYP
jgi:hypothetical protein